jgi:hypothetical protein
MSIPVTPALSGVTLTTLPELSVAALELDNAQRPERATADRWMAPDANLVPALFPK